MSLRTDLKIEYDALKNAIHRCHNPDALAYKDYGARGISVAPEWRGLGLASFIAFYDYIGPRPGPEYSLDRIDNDGNYEPGNVRWADKKTQQNNRRATYQYCPDYGWGSERKPGRGGSSPLIPYRGKSKTLSEWAVELGIKAPTIRQRLQKGLTPDQALSTTRLGNTKHLLSPAVQIPHVRTVCRTYQIGDERLTIRQMADRTGLHPHSIHARIKHNPDLDPAKILGPRKYVQKSPRGPATEVAKCIDLLDTGINTISKRIH